MTVGAIQPISGSAEKAADPKAEAYPTPQLSSSSSDTAQLFVNPTLKFDSTLGLLVIEFKDSSGNVSTSIPSQRQLDAYRLYQQPLPGQSQPAAPTVTVAHPAATATATAAAPVTASAPAKPSVPATPPETSTTQAVVKPPVKT